MQYGLEEKENGHCLQCGQPIYGRSDKKFCSDTCKSRYHDNEERASDLFRGRVITGLNSNYRLLKRLLQENIRSISLYDAECLGFSPGLFTSSIKISNGREEKRCFDIRYRQTSKQISKIERITPDLRKSYGKCR